MHDYHKSEFGDADLMIFDKERVLDDDVRNFDDEVKNFHRNVVCKFVSQERYEALYKEKYYVTEKQRTK